MQGIGILEGARPGSPLRKRVKPYIHSYTKSAILEPPLLKIACTSSPLPKKDDEPESGDATPPLPQLFEVVAKQLDFSEVAAHEQRVQTEPTAEDASALVIEPSCSEDEGQEHNE